MTKYLFFVSYIGTRFSGSQYQSNLVTVQNGLQHALALVLNAPSYIVRTMGSSRTDSGVHAFRSTFSTILSETIFGSSELNRIFRQDPASVKFPFDPDALAAATNYALDEIGVDLRILGARIVSDGFCVRRHVKSRTYLYRLCVLKPEFDSDNPNRVFLANQARKLGSLFEADRSWLIDSNFNVDDFAKAGKLFEGTHDFRNFSNPTDHGDKVIELVKSTKRSIRHVLVESGEPLYSSKYDPLANCFNYYDVVVNAKSFVYNQIRKMVGAMVSVAQGKATLDDVRYRLDNPDHFHGKRSSLVFQMAPAGGLYLQHLDYNEKDFDNPDPYYEPTSYSKEFSADSSLDDDEGAEDEEDLRSSNM